MKLIRRAERKNNVIGEAKLMPLPEGVVAVDTWVPTEEEKIVDFQGKYLVVDFKRVFGIDVVIQYNYFDIGLKEAYYKRLDVISKYINYFLKFYDTDKHLLMAYLKLKYLVDSKRYLVINRDSMIDIIQHILFDDDICNKIKRMSLDNYCVDLTSESKSKKGNKNYAPVMQFNEHHAEILMRISTAMKFAIPIVLHYIKTFHTKEEVKNNLYKYFMPLFKNPILIEDVNILGKLHHTIASRVNSYAKPDRAMYGKHEASGSSVETFIEELFHKNLITDTIFSYAFNGNIVSFNSVVLKHQLAFHSKEDLKMDYLLVSSEKEPEGLSGLDKMEMYSTKIDSFTTLFSQVNIVDTIERIKEHMAIEITQEEIDFYKEHHDFNTVSKELLFYFYAKTFGGFRDLNYIKREQYIQLMIIMKKMLRTAGSFFLSFVISANAHGKSTARIIRNSKFLEKITNSEAYKKLMETNYPTLLDDTIESPVIMFLSKIINTNWTYVEYGSEDKLNTEIEFNNDLLASEYLNFVDNI